MAAPLSIITDFAVILMAAGIVTYLFHKLNQPLILGYLIAGIIIGPYTHRLVLSKSLMFFRQPQILASS
jgi:Kef-type K+ transport system membrane component KefB